MYEMLANNIIYVILFYSMLVSINNFMYSHLPLQISVHGQHRISSNTS